MSQKVLNTMGWVLTILLALLFAMSAFMKLTKNDSALEQAAAVGIDAGTYQMLGVIEIISLILFLIPRTALLGSLLLIAYMGGAIATHLQHQQPIIMTVAIQSLLWIAMSLRFPVVRQNLLLFSQSTASGK